MPGGEGIEVFVPCGPGCTECRFMVHVALYLGDEMALITGHPTSVEFSGCEYRAVVYGDGGETRTAAATVTVLADTAVGQLVTGLPVPDRGSVPVKAPVEGEAVVNRFGKPVPVTIAGARDGRIIFGFPAGTLGPGTSGAPLIQGGGLIGVCKGAYGLTRHRWGFATLAPGVLQLVEDALWQLGYGLPGAHTGAIPD